MAKLRINLLSVTRAKGQNYGVKSDIKAERKHIMEANIFNVSS